MDNSGCGGSGFILVIAIICIVLFFMIAGAEAVNDGTLTLDPQRQQWQPQK